MPYLCIKHHKKRIGSYTIEKIANMCKKKSSEIDSAITNKNNLVIVSKSKVGSYRIDTDSDLTVDDMILILKKMSQDGLGEYRIENDWGGHFEVNSVDISHDNKTFHLIGLCKDR